MRSYGTRNVPGRHCRYARMGPEMHPGGATDTPVWAKQRIWEVLPNCSNWPGIVPATCSRFSHMGPATHLGGVADALESVEICPWKAPPMHSHEPRNSREVPPIRSYGYRNVPRRCYQFARMGPALCHRCAAETLDWAQKRT